MNEFLTTFAPIFVLVIMFGVMMIIWMKKTAHDNLIKNEEQSNKDSESVIEKLKGCLIESIFIDKHHQHFLCFLTDKGSFTFYPTGSGISESWFSDIANVKVLLDQRIKKITALPMTEDMVRSRQDCDQIYEYQFETETGVAKISYRNSSSGEEEDSHCWLELEKTAPTRQEMIAVTEDRSY